MNNGLVDAQNTEYQSMVEWSGMNHIEMGITHGQTERLQRSDHPPNGCVRSLWAWGQKRGSKWHQECMVGTGQKESVMGGVRTSLPIGRNGSA